MTLRLWRDLALAACVMSIVFCSHAAAQTIVDEWFSVRTGPAAVLLDPSSSSVVVATVAVAQWSARRDFKTVGTVSLPKAADELAPVSGWVPAAMLTRVKADMPVGTTGDVGPALQPAGTPMTSSERARSSGPHDPRFQAGPDRGGDSGAQGRSRRPGSASHDRRTGSHE